jgi:hypothetical protein
MFQRIPLNKLIEKNKKEWATFMIKQKQKATKKLKFLKNDDFLTKIYQLCEEFREKSVYLIKGANNEN